MFTKKRKQIGTGELILLVVGMLSLMFQHLVPPAILLIVFIAIAGIYLIWTRF